MRKVQHIIFFLSRDIKQKAEKRKPPPPCMFMVKVTDNISGMDSHDRISVQRIIGSFIICCWFNPIFSVFDKNVLLPIRE